MMYQAYSTAGIPPNRHKTRSSKVAPEHTPHFSMTGNGGRKSAKSASSRSLVNMPVISVFAVALLDMADVYCLAHGCGAAKYKCYFEPTRFPIQRGADVTHLSNPRHPAG